MTNIEAPLSSSMGRSTFFTLNFNKTVETIGFPPPIVVNCVYPS